MSAPYHDPRMLWAMPPDRFNAWRAANDLPLLLEFFLKRLPGFQQWMNENDIDAAAFCNLVPTGDWFEGERKLVIHTQNDARTFSYLHALTPGPEDSMVALRERVRPEKVFTEVEPYLTWARRNLGADRFFSIDGVNPAKTARPVFTSWREVVGVPLSSRVTLLRDFDLLKLGEVSVGDMIAVGGRNLDFADLDGITITGKDHGSFSAPINFSSCRNMQFDHTEVHFYKFNRCYLSNFLCLESWLYDITFTNCNPCEVKFVRSNLHKVSFVSSPIRPTFSDCELREISFTPAPEMTPAGVAEIHRLFRSAYQQGGQTQEAAEHYYLERTYRRKTLFYPYDDYDYRGLFPAVVRGVRSKDVPRLLEEGQYSELQCKEQIKTHRRYLWSVWTTPRFAWRALRFKARWLGSWLDNILWGYGERPLRIFGAAGVMILVYAALYGYWRDALNAAAGVRYSLLDCLYLSLVTFSTLGYGDITPKEPFMKLLCGSEAVLGAFTMGLVVAGFANKSRY